MYRYERFVKPDLLQLLANTASDEKCWVEDDLFDSAGICTFFMVNVLSAGDKLLCRRLEGLSARIRRELSSMFDSYINSAEQDVYNGTFSEQTTGPP